jgi:hypothetical protein
MKYVPSVRASVRFEACFSIPDVIDFEPLMDSPAASNVNAWRSLLVSPARETVARSGAALKREETNVCGQTDQSPGDSDSLLLAGFTAEGIFAAGEDQVAGF